MNSQDRLPVQIGRGRLAGRASCLLMPTCRRRCASGRPPMAFACHRHVLTPFGVHLARTVRDCCCRCCLPPSPPLLPVANVGASSRAVILEELSQMSPDINIREMCVLLFASDIAQKVPL